MIKFQGELKGYSFQTIRKQHPYLQKRVYDVLLALTPGQLQFELGAIPHTKDYKFCFEGIDPDTHQILSTVLAAMLEEQHLILTRDDLTLSYLRFRELMFLYEATRQGLMIAQVTETDTDYYFDVDEEPVSTAKPLPVKYRKRLRYYR